MNGTKFTFIAIGVVAIILFVYFIVVGFKIASSLFVNVIGAIAIIAVIIFLYYLLKKVFTKNKTE